MEEIDMRLKDDKTINEMAGKKLYSIYAEYVSGTPKEYVGKIKEYIILGTPKSQSDDNVMLWDVDKKEVCKEWLKLIRKNLNRNSIKTRIWGETYAYALTKENAEKCLKGLIASIEADYKRKQRWSDIETSRYSFTLDKLNNNGISDLIGKGIDAMDVTKLSSVSICSFSLPGDYKNIMDGRGIGELEILNALAMGKHIFENSGNDICNPGEKGRMIPEKEIDVLVKIQKDKKLEKTPCWNVNFDGNTYQHKSKWLKCRIYIKLPYNNYISIKKFKKFFNVYNL